MPDNVQVIFPKTRAVRLLYKDKVPGDYRQYPDGMEEIFYETSIDITALHQMAKRAASNKSGKASVGPLRVRILERRKI